MFQGLLPLPLHFVPPQLDARKLLAKKLPSVKQEDLTGHRERWGLPVHHILALLFTCLCVLKKAERKMLLFPKQAR